MAIARIGMPEIRQQNGSNEPTVQKDAVPQSGSASWAKNSLVYTNQTGEDVVLDKVATGGVLVYGLAPAASANSERVNPPDSLFGLNHFPFDVRDRILEINVVSATDGPTVIGTATGASWDGTKGANDVALAPGQQYGIYVAPSGTYSGYQFLNVNNTATPLFEIVALAPGQAVDDNNPRVWVKIIPTKIQG